MTTKNKRMGSRLAATARANFRLLSGVPRQQFLPRGLATMPLPTRRVADPAIHSEAPSESDTLATARAAATAEKKQKQTEHNKPTKEMDPFAPPKPPYAPSPRLKSPAVNEPIDPIPQQKRRQTTATNRASSIEDVNCAGLDGSPWPEERELERNRQVRRKEEEEDYKEYYGRHKASPLSEIEVADTRKPITRATDGTADSHVEYADGVVVWREEQLDTAEEALRRAMEIWKRSAMRGDPDSPHGRVLRALRGEDW